MMSFLTYQVWKTITITISIKGGGFIKGTDGIDTDDKRSADDDKRPQTRNQWNIERIVF